MFLSEIQNDWLLRASLIWHGVRRKQSCVCGPGTAAQGCTQFVIWRKTKLENTGHIILDQKILALENIDIFDTPEDSG